MPQPKPGDRFSFTYLDEPAGTPHHAVVQKLLSNRQEGLSAPETDSFVADWLDALLADPAAPAKPFTMMLSAERKTFIDGRPVSVTFE